MCGIAGYSGRFTAELLTAMGQAIEHRGPDAHGEVSLDTAGFAHRRLSILDLSAAGNQPMTLRCRCCGMTDESKPNDRVWLTYNGEIYNYLELRKELEHRGHQFFSGTDTEVILHLYVEEGIEGLKRLSGVFAFALYDGRPTGQMQGMEPKDVLLMRDNFGVKPLYYSQTSSGVLFASELKALLVSSAVSRELDPEAIAMYVSYLYAPAPSTAFKNVKKLEPGALLILRKGKIHRHSFFYEIPYTGHASTDSLEATTEELKTRLQHAVDRQQMSDVPVGAFLSGGMDSSAVVAMMKKSLGEKTFQCFTIGNSGMKPGADRDDLHFAKLVAKELSLDLNIVSVRPADFELLQTVIFHLDEPQTDPAAINSLLICREARRQGIKVLMSGAGGDDIFSGYPRHLATYGERVLPFVPHPLAWAIAGTARSISRSYGGSAFIKNDRLRKGIKALSQLDADRGERLAALFVNSSPDSVRSLFGARIQEGLSNGSILKPLKDALERIPGESDPLNRMLYLETKFFLGDHNLNYVDKTSMASGVEVRVPLIDPEVVNFVAGIPSRWKLRGLESKFIFKRAVRGLLPEAIYRRKKQGFGLPIQRWLKTDLHGVVHETLSQSKLRNRGIFNPAAVKSLMEAHYSGRVDATFPILTMVSMEMWCSRFLDTPSAASFEATQDVHSKPRQRVG